MPNAVRYGLVTQRLIERLRRGGVDLNPYLLFREGIRPHQTDWPELAAEFPSGVLTYSEVDAVAKYVPWGTPERVRARLDKGHLCIVLKREHAIAGYTWADFDEVNDSACDFEIGPGEAYLYDAFIAPEFRGHSLAPYMRAESYRHLREAGRHTFYSISDFFNAPAIKFKEKLNAEVIRLYLQIKLGGRPIRQWLLRDYLRNQVG